MANTANPGNESIDLAGTVYFEDVDDVFRVYFDWQDSSNHHYAEITLTSSNTASVALFRVSGGTTDQQGDTATNISVDEDTDELWELCVFAGKNRVGIYVGDKREWFETAGFFHGSSWGLGTGSITSKIEVDSLVANRSDRNGCRCLAPCDPDCPSAMRIDVTDGAIPEGCSGNCEEAGMMNEASFYLDFGGAPRIGEPGTCDIFVQQNGCGWYCDVVDWCDVLTPDTQSLIAWSIIAEPGDDVFEIASRIRVTYMESWRDETDEGTYPNWRERWVVFEDAENFELERDCKTMTNRVVPRLCYTNPDPGMLCADPEALSIDVTSIV
jgi:hypothetical protein